jgi:hypothetical protein
MTPQEKAKELVNDFYRIIPLDKMTIDYNLAKKCALIVVAELIKENLRYDYIPFEGSRTEFYLKVEQEIQNL